MDRERFDALARLLATQRSRRGALGAILGVALLGHEPDVSLAKSNKGQGKGNGRGKNQRKDKSKGRSDRNEPDALEQESAGATADDGGPALKAQSQGGGKKRSKGKKGGKGKGKAGNQNAGNDSARLAQAESGTCCGPLSCSLPKKGGNFQKCNYSGMDLSGINADGANMQQVNGQGTIFSTLTKKSSYVGANFGRNGYTACLQRSKWAGANLRGANFDQACLFDADFSGAIVNTSTNMQSARFCRTKMPDGTINNRDCNKGNACCSACDAQNPCPDGKRCCGGKCVNGDECCAASDCPDRQCNTKTCSNGQCQYTPVKTGPGPKCDTTCCNGVCCPAGKECVNGQCTGCQPDCVGKECGPDGCGGYCGTCETGQVCNANGKCVCNATSCPHGCCDDYGVCHTPPTNQYCGLGGERCDICTAQEQCVGGDCVPKTCSGNCANDEQCPNVGTCVCNTTKGECCTPEPKSQTCDGKCGNVVNNCGKTVDCGPCPERTCKTGVCNDQKICEYTKQPNNQPGTNCNTICCNANCCTGGQVCYQDNCCTPHNDVCQGKCGTVVNNCGQSVNCGPCAERLCKTGSCGQNNICVYTPVGNGQPGPKCPAPGFCCGGDECCSSNQVCHNDNCCTPIPTCPANACGEVPNGCGGKINCGPCAERTCQNGTCNQQNICVYVDSPDNQPGPKCPAPKFCCDGDCCEQGNVCLANGCCPPESKEKTCQGKCGTVRNNCGQQVDCGGCDIDVTCSQPSHVEPFDGNPKLCDGGKRVESPSVGCKEISFPCGCTVEWCVSVGDEGEELSFGPVDGKPACTVERVVVKGGNEGANIYTFDPATFCSDGLTTPTDQEISHFDFCGVTCAAPPECCNNICCAPGKRCQNNQCVSAVTTAGATRSPRRRRNRRNNSG